jgi:hypothetical protein
MAQEPSPFASWGQGSVAAAVPPVPAAPDAPEAAPDAPEAPKAAPGAHHHAHVHVTLPRLILCAALAAALAAALVLALGGSAPRALTLLRGATFTSVVPAGYALTRTYPLPGFEKFQLTAGAAAAQLPLASAAVPPAGAIELTVSDVPLSVAATASHNARLALLPPLALLPLVVKLPGRARHVVASQPLHSTTLAGQAAAAITYIYTDHGVANVQSDIVTRRGSQLVGLELSSEPALRARALAAERTLLAHWSWTSPVVN